jgi:hypothetical protein
MSRSYTSSPPQAPPWRVAGLLYFTYFKEVIVKRLEHAPVASFVMTEMSLRISQQRSVSEPPKGDAATAKLVFRFVQSIRTQRAHCGLTQDLLNTVFEIRLQFVGFQVPMATSSL